MKIFALGFFLVFFSGAISAQSSKGVQMKISGNILLVETGQATDLLQDVLWARCDSEICSYMSNGPLEIQHQVPPLIKKILSLPGVDSILVLTPGSLVVKKLATASWSKIAKIIFNTVLSQQNNRYNNSQIKAFLRLLIFPKKKSEISSDFSLERVRGSATHGYAQLLLVVSHDA